MRYSKLVSMIVIVAFLIVGCSGEPAEESSPVVESEATEETNESETTEIEEKASKEIIKEETNEDNNLAFLEEVPNIPTDSTALINQLQGPYASIDVRNDEVKSEVLENVNKLPPLSENAGKEEIDTYFNYLYSLVAVDFPDPQDTINEWEMVSFGNPDLPDSRFHFKENYNIEILLDSSGSMGFYAGDKTRMQVAKEAINEFVKNAPQEANISLRVYGHEGTGDDSDKALSCETIEQVYGFAPYNEGEFQSALENFEPAGWTPLAAAMEASNETMESLHSEENTNLIYIVSDGIETCDGDPVKVAEQLSASNAKPIINVIGFQTDAEAQAQLKEVARVADGIYASANNQDELQAEFERAEASLEAWVDWKEDALKDVNAMENHNYFDIMAVTNEWFKLELQLKNNLTRLIRIFKDEGIVNAEQADEFREKRDEIEKLIDETEVEVEEQLNNISADSLEKMKQEINKKYDENSQE